MATITQRIQRAEKTREQAYQAYWAKQGDQAYEAVQTAEKAILNLRGQLYAGQTYTEDGGTADRTQWCECRGAQDDGVYYEAYSTFGLRTAHGWICKTCRAITQAG
jgi:hypothetical protein